ncbi:MAG: X-Pro dipeptidyl-peptidase, partial [Bacteroidota bacterium]
MRLILLLTALTFMAIDANAQADWVRQHYTKSEHMVPMRDGTQLFTSIYVPKDDSRTYPILFQRTPYGVGPYGEGVKPSLGPS